MTEKKKPPREKMNAPLPISVYHLELDATTNGMSVILSGIKGIVEVADESIKIMTASGTVTVMGTKLNIAVFEYKTLQIVGKIENISISKKDKTRRKYP